MYRKYKQIYFILTLSYMFWRAFSADNVNFISFILNMYILKLFKFNLSLIEWDLGD